MGTQNVPADDQMLEFVKAYWLAQPAAVRVLRTMPNAKSDGSINEDKLAYAAHLSELGLDIDAEIMAWDYNPFWTMQWRISQNLNRSYMNGKPVKNSTALSDYPPFDPPVTTPPAEVKMVGPNAVGNIYYCLPAGIALPDGKIIIEGGVAYMKLVSIGLMGATHLFKKVT